MTESMAEIWCTECEPLHTAAANHCCGKWYCKSHFDMHRRRTHHKDRVQAGKCAMDGCGSGCMLNSVWCENHAVAPPEGRKYDSDKPRYDLIPFKALGEVVGVLTYGAKKYAPEDWRKVEGWRWRYFGAALRHMVAWFGGERVDPESGHKHLAHAVCCLMFALELDAQ